MPSVRPKTIVSGGISPKGWTSVFTLLLVMVGIYQLGGEYLFLHPESQSWPAPQKLRNGDYLLENYKFTGATEHGTPVTKNRSPE
jgi:hypothetical protein